MSSKFKLQIRLLAVLILGLFVLQDLAWALPDLGMRSVRVPTAPADGTIALGSPLDLSVPFESASAREVHVGTNGKFIIHIQDPHANYSGELNLSRTLESIMKTHGIKLILGEGSQGDMTLDRLKPIADAATWKIVAKRFLRDSVIVGEEHLNLTYPLPMKIVGVEDPALYDESLEIYEQLTRNRARVLGYVRTIRNSLERLKNRHYPKELLRYESKAKSAIEDPVKQLDLIESFRLDPDRGQPGGYPAASFEPYPAIQKLQALRGDEKAILSAPLRKKSDYRRYLRAVRKLNLEKVLDELDRAENDLYREALPDESQRRLRAIERFLDLLEKAYSIRMSSTDFEDLLINQKDFKTVDWQAFLNGELSTLNYYDDLIPYKKILEDSLKPIRRFYRLVNRRDHAFVRNSLQAMDDRGEHAAFLITGGYHTAHLTELLKQEGCSYVVLTPHVDHQTDQARYEQVLLTPIALKNKETRLAAKPVDNNPRSTLRQEYVQGNPAAFAARLSAAYPNGIYGLPLSAIIDRVTAAPTPSAPDQGARMAEVTLLATIRGHLDHIAGNDADAASLSVPALNEIFRFVHIPAQTIMANSDLFGAVIRALVDDLSRKDEAELWKRTFCLESFFSYQMPPEFILKNTALFKTVITTLQGNLTNGHLSIKKTSVKCFQALFNHTPPEFIRDNFDLIKEVSASLKANLTDRSFQIKWTNANCLRALIIAMNGDPLFDQETIDGWLSKLEHSNDQNERLVSASLLGALSYPTFQKARRILDKMYDDPRIRYKEPKAFNATEEPDYGRPLRELYAVLHHARAELAVRTSSTGHPDSDTRFRSAGFDLEPGNFDTLDFAERTDPELRSPVYLNTASLSDILDRLSTREDLLASLHRFGHSGVHISLGITEAQKHLLAEVANMKQMSRLAQLLMYANNPPNRNLKFKKLVKDRRFGVETDIQPIPSDPSVIARLHIPFGSIWRDFKSGISVDTHYLASTANWIAWALDLTPEQREEVIEHLLKMYTTKDQEVPLDPVLASRMEGNTYFTRIHELRSRIAAYMSRQMDQETAAWTGRPPSNAIARLRATLARVNTRPTIPNPDPMDTPANGARMAAPGYREIVRDALAGAKLIIRGNQHGFDTGLPPENDKRRYIAAVTFIREFMRSFGVLDSEVDLNGSDPAKLKRDIEKVSDWFFATNPDGNPPLCRHLGHAVRVLNEVRDPDPSWVTPLSDDEWNYYGQTLIQAYQLLFTALSLDSEQTRIPIQFMPNASGEAPEGRLHQKTIDAVARFTDMMRMHAFMIPAIALHPDPRVRAFLRNLYLYPSRAMDHLSRWMVLRWAVRQGALTRDEELSLLSQMRMSNLLSELVVREILLRRGKDPAVRNKIFELYEKGIAQDPNPAYLAALLSLTDYQDIPPSVISGLDRLASEVKPSTDRNRDRETAGEILLYLLRKRQGWRPEGLVSKNYTAEIVFDGRTLETFSALHTRPEGSGAGFAWNGRKILVRDKPTGSPVAAVQVDSFTGQLGIPLYGISVIRKLTAAERKEALELALALALKSLPDSNGASPLDFTVNEARFNWWFGNNLSDMPFTEIVTPPSGARMAGAALEPVAIRRPILALMGLGALPRGRLAIGVEAGTVPSLRLALPILWPPARLALTPRTPVLSDLSPGERMAREGAASFRHVRQATVRPSADVRLLHRVAVVYLNGAGVEGMADEELAAVQGALNRLSPDRLETRVYTGQMPVDTELRDRSDVVVVGSKEDLLKHADRLQELLGRVKVSPLVVDDPGQGSTDSRIRLLDVSAFAVLLRVEVKQSSDAALFIQEHSRLLRRIFGSMPDAGLLWEICNVADTDDLIGLLNRIAERAPLRRDVLLRDLQNAVLNFIQTAVSA